MFIAAYKDKVKNEITSVHEVKDNTLAELDEKVRGYNENKEGGSTVEVFFFEDNSLEVFLFNRSEIRIRDCKDRLDNIVYSFDHLADTMHRFNEQLEREVKLEKAQ